MATIRPPAIIITEMRKLQEELLTALIVRALPGDEKIYDIACKQGTAISQTEFHIYHRPRS